MADPVSLFLAAMNNFYMFFATNASLTLIIGAIFVGIWFWDQIIRNPEEEEEIPWYIKAVDYSGFFVGLLILIPTSIVMIVNGYSLVWEFNIYSPVHYPIFTKILILLVGISLFFKPLKDAPIATIIALIGGGIVALFVIGLIQTPIEVVTLFFGFDPKYIFLIIFLLIFILVALLMYFVAKIIAWIGKVLASKPISMVLMGICIIEAILIFIPIPTPGTLSIGMFFEFLIMQILASL